MLARTAGAKWLRRRSVIIIRALVALSFLTTLVGVAPRHPVQAQTVIEFTGTELLGRPTDSSVTIKIVPDDDIQYYYEYGTSSGAYTGQTSAVSATGGQPHEVTLTGLSANTRYYYRMQYNYNATGWVVRPEGSFVTQRAAGEPFTFTITSDSHVNIMLGNATTWQQTLNNVADDPTDFHLDLGDTFAVYTAVQPGEVDDAEAAYTFQLPFFNTISHSAPVFLAAGNHEQTEGWHRTETANVADSLPAMSINAMKKFYLNPVPDSFYSGNADTFSYIAGDGKLGNYYAWEWGDALFMVIDPFWYTETKPYTGAGGGGEVSTGSGDRWDWTLGVGQFNWLAQTLQESEAPYKFIFAHHMVGGSDDYVRGGAVPAHMFEWGGYNLGGTTWGFNTQRPDWGSAPVHQIMVDTGVSAFFHGHDHEYAYEIRDGIVYQSMPSASFTGSFGIYTESNPYTERVIPGSGYLRVTVDAMSSTVEFVSSAANKDVLHSYTIAPNQEPAGDFTITASAGAGGTISPSGEVLVSAGANRAFTITPNGGYQIANVLVDGVSVGAPASYTFTDVQGDHTIAAGFVEAESSGVVTLDGVSSATAAANAGSISFSHTTGAGADRLTLVGISWNAGSTARSISSVVFTYGTGQELIFDEVRTQQAGTNLRYAAIYRSRTEPPSNTAGTVTVTFSGNVSNGIVAGAANFSGVDQATPLGPDNGANGDSTAASVALTGLDGDELVFDTVFQGASGDTQTLTPGAGQSAALWNAFVSNTRAAASMEQATDSSVTMSWTAGSSSFWAIAAVAINPTPGAPPTCYALTLTSGAHGAAPTGSPTQSTGCGVGEYTAGTVIALTADPDAGYRVAGWSGTSDNAAKTLTNEVVMPAQAHTVGVTYEEAPPAVEPDGAVSSGTANNVTAMSFSHTTGTGDNRLTLVGVSWNAGTAAKRITGVSFTYGSEVLDFVEVETEEVTASGTASGPRYAAIYASATQPPAGTAGTITIQFDASIENGIVAGAANFTGVDQVAPLGTPVGAHATAQTGSDPSVTLTGLVGDELVFDTAFLGGADSSYTLSVGPDQTQQWNAFSTNTRGAAGTEQAEGSSVTMSWTASTQNWWALVAVPIRPAPVTGTNSAPTDITLSSTSVMEGQPAGTVVGSFSTVDPDPGDTHTYSLVAGSGSSGNSSFTITGNQLRTAAAFDYDAQNSYAVRIRTTDQGGLFHEKAFTIAVTEGGTPPVIPSSFYGELLFVDEDGAPGAGDMLDAYVDGESDPIRSAAIVAAGDDLVYTINVPAYPDGTHPDAVMFRIGGRTVAIADWVSGTNVELNLHPPKADAGGPYVVPLSTGSVTLQGTASDRGDDVASYAWDLDDDGLYDDANGAAPQFTFTEVGTFPIGLRVVDAKGGEGVGTSQVFVITLSGTTGQVYDGTGKVVTVAGVDAPYSYLVLYNGSATAPINAGTYPVTVQIMLGADVIGTYDTELVIGKAPATVTLGSLTPTYDGTPKAATATTVPADLDVTITYDGSATPPIAAGSYAVVATVVDDNYEGSANGTLEIGKATATVTLGDLSHTYDGTPKAATATTVPADLDVTITYDGSATPPTAAGSYAVVATVVDDNYEGGASDTMTITGVAHSIVLVPGWNLVSFNLKPVDTTVAEVLDSIAGNYDLVYAWDATGGHSGAGNWMRHDPAVGFGNSLEALDDTQGFWVHMTTADVLEVVGTHASSTDIPLVTAAGGWNLVGYPSASSSDLPGALSAIAGDTTLVLGYRANDTADPWKIYDPAAPGYANDLEAMAPGWGYWIRVTGATTLPVTY